MPKRKERPGVDKYGRNDLINAVIDNNMQEVIRLLQSGMEVNKKDDNGWTALHFAAQNNCYEQAKVLIEYGAEIDSQDSIGNAPLFKALFSYAGNDTGLIKLLLEKGANPDLKNYYGNSPKDLAQKVTNFDLIQFFK